MDLTPGAAARDSRSLSVEAAQYDAQAIDAETELCELEARVKAMRAKADEARFQKQKSEAAREEAFQMEQEERQAAVRKSITDHHIEGMRKAINYDTQHLINDLKKVAAGDNETAPNATTFVGAMVLRELVGHDAQFLADIAGKVLADPVAVTASGIQQSQGYNALPKHQVSSKLAPTSPSPTKSPYLLPQSPQASLTSPRSSTYGRDESPELGVEGSEATGSLRGNHEPGLLITKVAGEEAFETLTASEEQEAAEDIAVDIDEYTSRQQAILAKSPLAIMELHKENDTVTGWINDEPTPAEESLNTMAGVEYSTQHDDVTVADAHPVVLKQEPSASINELASLAKLKRQSTESNHSYETDTASTTLASFHVVIPKKKKEEESAFSRPQTPQPATPIPKKLLAGLDAQQKSSPASKKQSGKRKRQESEVSTAAAGESGETTTTPAKKGKTKAKDENAVPKRVTDFVKKVKAVTSANQPEEVLCSICGVPPKGPRLSRCLHMYCETCWKTTAKQSGKTKGMEQLCMRDGCNGVLGKAVNVPAHFSISNMKSEIWTGQKAKSGLTTAEDQLDAMEVNEGTTDVE